VIDSAVTFRGYNVEDLRGLWVKWDIETEPMCDEMFFMREFKIRAEH
jgi:hypothetical protein